MKIQNFHSDTNWNVSFMMLLDSADIGPFLEEESAKLQQKKAVPGYRAGKAPLKMALSYYGSDLLNTARDSALTAFFPQACVLQDVTPISEPVYTVIGSGPEEMVVAVNFTAFPSLNSLTYKGLAPERPVKTCSEADIDAELAEYMLRHLYVHRVQRPAGFDDIVEVDFDGTCDGEEFELSHGRNMRFPIGTGRLFAGLDDALIGHVDGDELDLTLTMPEDFHREAVQGKTLQLHVRLIGVWARDMQECTDEYVRENVIGCDTVAEIREKLRAEIQSKYNSKSARIYEQNLRKELIARVDCVIPEPLVQAQLDHFLLTLASLAAADEKTVIQALEDEGMTVEDFRVRNRGLAEEQIKITLASEYIVRAEGLTVTDEEIDKSLELTAQSQKTTVADVRMSSDLEEITQRLLNEKALRIVRDSAVPQDYPVDEFDEEQLARLE